MSPDQYRAALASLGLSQLAAGRWLGVSPKTAQRYATEGPTGPAARAIEMAVALIGVRRFDELGWSDNGERVLYDDVAQIVGLP